MNHSSNKNSDKRHRNDPIQRWDTKTLFAGQSLIEISHRKEIYRLQITRQGKLILTK
jgi:hemin uptake protein HemP